MSQYLWGRFLRGFLGERLLDLRGAFFSFDFDLLLRSLSLLLDRLRGDLDRFLSLSRFLSDDRSEDLSTACWSSTLASAPGSSLVMVWILWGHSAELTISSLKLV